MKAAMYDHYGPPEVVELRDIAKPIPARNELLIKVVATTVTSADWRARSLEVPSGFGPLARLSFGLTAPKQQILGTELAGVIEATGEDVRGFKPGDAVIAFTGLKFGCHVEYKTVPEDGMVVHKPANLTFEHGAALAFGGGTAWHFLQAKGRVQPNENVLIIGGCGAVGSSAVQLARHLGAKVTAVCSTPNVELVRSLGANHVIDYTKEDFAQGGEIYDVIFDTVGAARISHSSNALKPGGRLLLCAEGMSEMLTIPVRNLFGRKKIIAGTADERFEYLQALARLAETGEFTPLIDRTYPLADIREAHAYVAAGRKRGSVVVLV
jgi:NADPH:quinone reductase-like Zn-dependent oxidoreductase